MKQQFSIVIYILIFLTSCQENQSKESIFSYDPTVSYPILNQGDFWLDKFDQRGLQNAVIYRDKIYCNTIDVRGNKNFLYCLNPINGLVSWRAQVEAYATQPVSFCADTIIYCSYLGDVYTFNRQGIKIWQNKFDLPYGGHWVDTINSTLLVKTVYWKDVAIYNISSGKIISKIESNSLQMLIENNIKKAYPMQKKEYRFERMKLNYIIKCELDETRKYKIEINNYP